ncbi:MAG: DNA primase [Candidatus Dependentiae bacterium]|nr:DNA primase [Candidatus Dependentiae bacterium]
MSLFNFIKSSLSILDVVGNYTTLKKAGLYWKGHCPFHNEKTASFTVSPHKEIYYCFGCNSGGDLISFIAKVENCSPIEAAKLLVERYQLNPPADTFDGHEYKPEKSKHYYELCKAVATWCHESLLQSPMLMDYLKKRGFTKNMASYFTIGYFPGGLAAVQNLMKAMGTHQILPHDLIEANILSQGKTVLYSPFEERLMFPIKDHLGRYCGFGGRVFKPHDERPKYYNSRENEFFTKGSLLFGIDLAKKSIQETETAFLVEGYTDCVAMVQHGYPNTVATLGTACTTEHLKQLARYTQQLYIIYDSDNAGHQAILRLTELCWQVSLEPKVICLPAKEDPASFLGKGNDLKPLIAKAQDIFMFFIDAAGNEFSTKPLSEKIALVRKLVATIHNIDDSLKRDILLQKAAKTLDIPLQSMQNELARTALRYDSQKESLRVSGTELSLASAQPKTVAKPEKPANTPPVYQPIPKLEKMIFSAIMDNMQLFNSKNDKYLLEYLPAPLRDILEKLKSLTEHRKGIDFIQFFDTLNEYEQQYVSKLLLEQEEKNIQPEAFEQLVLQFHKKNWKSIVHAIKTKLTQAKNENNIEDVEKLMQDFLELKQAVIEKNII